MTDWIALARARGLDVPAEQVERLAGSLEALTTDFAALKTKIPFDVEPAITLSERAVQGE